ncbi:hydrogenase 2 membrane subunit [uncultured Gammaproteobacteria bacterium]
MQHEPVGGRILTKPVIVCAALFLIGITILCYRFVYGLGAVIAVNDGYPWGIWIVVDVMIGSAFGCAGYAVAVLVYMINRNEYHPLVRPALMASLFGYGLAAIGVFVDLGRWWQFYSLFVPWRWNFTSVMLETGLCISGYFMIMMIEFAPTFLEKFGLHDVRKKLDKWLFVVIALGVLLPTMHQSSLGSILIILGHKLSPLWQTQMLPLLYLMSAVLMGFGIVVFDAVLSAHGFRRPLEMFILQRLAGVMVWLLSAFLIIRVVDLTARDAWPHAFNGTVMAFSFWMEMVLMALPLLFLGPRMNRIMPQSLFSGAVVLLLGGILYRLNSYMIGYTPAVGNWHYFPTTAEILVTLGMFAAEVGLTIVFIKWLPVLLRPNLHLPKRS